MTDQCENLKQYYVVHKLIGVACAAAKKSKTGSACVKFKLPKSRPSP